MYQPYIESATALSDMDTSPNHFTPTRAVHAGNAG